MTLSKYSANAADICPRPQAGSRQVPCGAITYSARARVAQGGVGKSSRASLGDARCAITASDVFCWLKRVSSHPTRFPDCLHAHVDTQATLNLLMTYFCCESARRPDADRRAKVKIITRLVGSNFVAYSQLSLRLLPKCWVAALFKFCQIVLSEY